ncbi:MAG: bifunctional phosphoserine phosphatase/homoserine phosphotransferase ThrH [Actinomycetota bacterium]|nr:bifunctional phosphoserine phosphatase/homoserine phosphotransferase ThrH [Actinomycetota bacterium]MEC9059190.1 bifunctional phosphoserine phosphatase/homoserine phosphotransferase ThrH [Actinomycetota bacterium]MEE3257229.1 bifunctional phosphoserine phosphatase/homoserine phosphotransferase ThrH [Actinomycetota bacterium]
MQRIIALDMEGVITPEIWIAVATHTGLPELRLTTRDEPDYHKLMGHRISVLSEHGIGLGLIQEVISELDLLEGARDFLDRLRKQHQVVVLSDTFEQFAGHFMDLLGYPHLLCHRLELEDDRITQFVPRVEDAKLKAVASYQGQGYHVTAIGDSHNDIGMLSQADASCLFRAPVGLPEKYPNLHCLEAYHDLSDWIKNIPEQQDQEMKL